jgi:4-hydroxy-tetrahydrodipicolinate synthase
MQGIWAEPIWRSCAVLTPVAPDGEVDHGRLAAHCRSLASRGFDIPTLFGTTGEGPAFTVRSRVTAVEQLLASGHPADRVLLGVGSAALGDMVELAVAARRLGLAGVLATPPFYFREADEAGLFRAYAALIERCGADCPPILLYHIPAYTGLPLGLGLVERLATTFPEAIRGVKDSSGDLANTLALLERFPGLVVLGGIERQLPDVMERGGRGTICGWANIVPEIVGRLLDGDRAAAADLAPYEQLFTGRPFLPVLKALLAERLDDPAWRRVLPPLTAFEGALGPQLAAAA